jgi:glutamate dehydrogenase/leucine dehydrogenase
MMDAKDALDAKGRRILFGPGKAANAGGVFNPR